MISPKEFRSSIIAAVSTLCIHLLLIGLLSLKFSEGGNADPFENTDLTNLELQLEDMAIENMSITDINKETPPPAENTESENISSDKKPSSSTKVSTTLQAPKEQISKITPPDTVRVKEEQAEITKKDAPKTIPVDSALYSQIQKQTKAFKSANTTKRKQSDLEKYEFYRKNYKSIRNFMKVYPYAIKTRELLENLNAQLKTMKSESEKVKLIKETEKQLFRDYESAVRTMTVTQGKLLLKLIARETNTTGYEIIKNYKGAFSASFWYSVGKLFGTDLKTDYHREQEDSTIETIIERYK